MAEDDLEKAARERREMLRSLREAVHLVGSDEKQSQEEQEDHGNEEADEQQEQHQDVRFRNYIPRTKDLQSNKVIPPAVPKFEDPVAPAPISNSVEDPFLSIAPKKANWDLRRNISKSLEKLEKRTQKALIELMYEEERRRQALAEADEQVPEE